jgi:hypothetical protein
MIKKTNIISKNRTGLGHTMQLIKTLSTNDSFYTHASSSVVSRYATLYGRKVKIERILGLRRYSSIDTTIERLTKVTIL